MLNGRGHKKFILTKLNMFCSLTTRIHHIHRRGHGRARSQTSVPQRIPNRLSRIFLQLQRQQLLPRQEQRGPYKNNEYI